MDGPGRIAMKGRHILPQILELQHIDPFGIDVDHHHVLIPVGEGLDQGAARLAITADQEEGFALLPDATGKSQFVYRMLERAVLHQRQDVANRIDPGDNRQVDGKHNPQPLSFGKRMGNLSEADGG